MRIILSLLVALLFGGTANAADFPSTKDAPLAIGVEATTNPFAGLYIGVNTGGQFTSIAISGAGYDELLDGISNDGLVGGGHVGFNLCPGRVCVGAYFEGGWSDGTTTFADVDILKFDAYRQIGAKAGGLLGRSTLVSIHAGYEWQDWTAGDKSIGFEVDASVTAWVLGADIETIVTNGLSLGIKADYLVFDGVDVKGVGDASKYLDKSEALRIQATLNYYPQVDLPALPSFARF